MNNKIWQDFKIDVFSILNNVFVFNPRISYSTILINEEVVLRRIDR